MNALIADWRLCTCGHIALEHADDGTCLIDDCWCDTFTEVVA